MVLLLVCDLWSTFRLCRFGNSVLLRTRMRSMSIVRSISSPAFARLLALPGSRPTRVRFGALCYPFHVFVFCVSHYEFTHRNRSNVAGLPLQSSQAAVKDHNLFSPMSLRKLNFFIPPTCS